MEHFKSVFTNEQDLLKAILQIHNNANPIELDPMYYKGGFYKNGVERPKYIFDISPRVDYCPKGNAENLPIESNSITCMILDPLFIFGLHGNTEKYYISQKMGILKDFNELKDNYTAILKEARRVLKFNGVLVFKCQDFTDSKTTMTHSYVYNWAVTQGFYAKDLAILVRPNKVCNTNTVQRHLRKIHTYFWVFKRRKMPEVI